MLYLNEKNRAMFDTCSGITQYTDAVGIYESNGYIIHGIPRGLRDIWISFDAYVTKSSNALATDIYVAYESGPTDNIRFWSNNPLYLPSGKGKSSKKIEFSNNLVTDDLWCTIRIHVWIDESDSTKIHFTAYNDGKVMVENMVNATTTGDKFKDFTQIKFSKNNSSTVYIKNVIISDKFFGESAKIKKIPITQIKNWTKNPDTGVYYATKKNQQGTLVVDPLLVADLEKYDVISTAINGIMTREGEDIKNLEITVGDKTINQNLAYGTNRLSIDIGNDLTSLSNVTIETKE